MDDTFDDYDEVETFNLAISTCLFPTLKHPEVVQMPCTEELAGQSKEMLNLMLRNPNYNLLNAFEDTDMFNFEEALDFLIEKIEVAPVVDYGEAFAL
jgi:hypothetical protein